MHELGRLLLGDEYFDGYLASNEGNEIGDIVRLQEAVDGKNELVEAGLLTPRGVRDGLMFWEGGLNVVFPEANCPGIMLKVDDGFKAAVELCRLQVQVTMPEIAEWVGDIVGRV